MTPKASKDVRLLTSFGTKCQKCEVRTVGAAKHNKCLPQAGGEATYAAARSAAVSARSAERRQTSDVFWPEGPKGAKRSEAARSSTKVLAAGRWRSHLLPRAESAGVRLVRSTSLSSRSELKVLAAARSRSDLLSLPEGQRQCTPKAYTCAGLPCRSFHSARNLHWRSQCRKGSRAVGAPNRPAEGRSESPAVSIGSTPRLHRGAS